MQSDVINSWFSVVIPLFNKGDTISRAISSVLEQVYPFYELIVIDDGSTDDGGEIIRQLKNSRIRYYFQKNSGVSAARNFGVSVSQYEWIAFLDADDEYYQGFLFEVNNFIQRHAVQDIAFIGSSYMRNVNGIKHMYQASQATGINSYFALFNNLNSPSNSSTTVVNRLFFDKVGGFPDNLKYNEDWFLWFKLNCLGEYGYIAKPGAIINVMPNSTSKTIDLVKLGESAKYLSKEIWGTLNLSAKNYKFKVDAYSCINQYLIDVILILIKNGKYRDCLHLLGRIKLAYIYKIALQKLIILMFWIILPFKFRSFIKTHFFRK